MANGSWMEDAHEIEVTSISYFENMFASSTPTPTDLEKVLQFIPTKVTQSTNQRLLLPYTGDEVLLAVKQMFPTKAPEPDCYPAFFYQRYWDIVGPQTIDECLRILNNNGSLEHWNATNIALIPKIKNPKSVSDYCPISLCNVAYKIVAKVLASPWKHYLARAVGFS